MSRAPQSKLDEIVDQLRRESIRLDRKTFAARLAEQERVLEATIQAIRDALATPRPFLESRDLRSGVLAVITRCPDDEGDFRLTTFDSETGKIPTGHVAFCATDHGLRQAAQEFAFVWGYARKIAGDPSSAISLPTDSIAKTNSGEQHMAKAPLPYEAGENPVPYSVTLHNTQAGADKIYKLSIEPAGDLWVVNYANGRRGSTLATGTKTKEPVDWVAARKACNKVLAEKVGGGYLPIGGSELDADGKADAIATAEKRQTGWLPQLLNPVDEPEEIAALIDDSDWVGQQKYDGERRFLIVNDAGKVSAANRKGETVPVDAPLREAMEALGVEAVLDGEQIGDRFYCWDILAMGGSDLRERRLEERQDWLEALWERAGIGSMGATSALVMVETAYDAAAKRRLIERVSEAGGEGVVFKRLDAPYEPGRPNSEGNWVKHKFWQSLSAVVETVNDKRSVGLALFDDADRSSVATSGGDARKISVGNVTIPANQDIPAAGDVVEVRYLYAYEDGSLFQPTYLGKRNDIDPSECLASQRVFKTEHRDLEPEREASNAPAP